MHIADLPLLLIIYLLVRPVSASLAMLVVLFDAVQTAVLVATKLQIMLPLFLASGASYLGAFDHAQLDALAYLSLRMDAHGFGFGLIDFGCGCLVLGYLIRRASGLTAVFGAQAVHEDDEVRAVTTAVGFLQRLRTPVLRGEVPAQFQGIYQEGARGKVLTLSGLQFWLAAQVPQHARSAGVRQQVEFPTQLLVSFPPDTPVFVPAR